MFLEDFFIDADKPETEVDEDNGIVNSIFDIQTLFFLSQENRLKPDLFWMCRYKKMKRVLSNKRILLA